LDDLIINIDTKLGKSSSYVGFSDLSITVLIKLLKNSSKLLLSRQLTHVDSSRYELVIVNLLVLVIVQLVQNGVEVILGQTISLQTLES
jgi:hypothetical protein